MILILDRLLILPSEKYSLLSSLKTSTCTSLFRHPIFHWIKSACASLLINKLWLSKPKLSLLGLLNTFVNNAQFILDLI